MPQGGKLEPKDKVQLKNTGSDGSDEDYMMGDDEEFDESEDEYFSSLADDETDGSSGEFEEEKEFDERVRKKIKKVGRKNSMLSHDKKQDDDIGGLCRKKEEDFAEGKPRNMTWVSSTKKNVDHYNEKPRKKTKVSYREENEDSDFDDSDEDEDEEFTPDEVDVVDDDEELPGMKENKVDKLKMHEAQSAKGKKQKRNFKALKRTRRKKSIKKRVLRRKNRYHGKESRGKGPVAQKTKRSTKSGRGMRKSDASSDSDFMTSRLSDFEYSISEEEREQIREAGEFCGRLTTSSRSSSCLKMIKEEDTVPSERKLSGRKDKEKMVDMKIEVGKQVCGICLSEEGKRTVKGILNCCSHYFCFACIMEWSKVESRCPLCKRRFKTITRTAQVDGGHHPSDVVIPVPERDQVYQPSEEELRRYIDPYENVICTECHQGGDDALMLLCDICDSPAHTYCVGLGREVPEGNWYCNGCRPAVLASSNAQAPNTTPDGGANNLSAGSSAVRENFDLNELYVPETRLSRETEHSPSPRYSIGDFQAASRAARSGAFTLYERRRIQQQIRLLLNRSRQSERSDGVGPVSGISLFGPQISRDVVAPLQGVPVQEAPQNTNHQRRLQDYTTPSVYGREVLQPRSISLRGQVRHHQASTSTDHSLCGPPHTEVSATTARIGHGLGHQQLRRCNRLLNASVNASISPSQLREVSHPSPEKEHVQSMVRSHLKSLSRNLDLDYFTFKCIARTSTHTILAAVGHEHRLNEIFPVRTRPLTCDHLDSIASQKTRPFAGQCSSCFDWFIGKVVREVMSSRLPLLYKD